MSISVIFLVVALILFLLAAFNVPARSVGLGWLGLAFVTLSWLVSGGGLHLS
jgi:hypothetical protein